MCRFSLYVLAALLVPTHALAFTFVVTEPTTPLVPTSVIDLAQQLGYFAREGVEVRLLRVNGTPMAIAAMSSGEADMAEISVESLMKLTARGERRFRAVASPAKSLSYVIAARDSVGSLINLSGRLFGIGQPGTLDDTLSRTVLRRLGVDPTGLNMVSVGHPQLRLKALKAGKIDATTVSYGTWLTLRDKAGLHLLVTKEDYFRAAPVIAKVNIVRTQAIRDQPGEVVKVTAALILLARDLARDPARWAQAMRSRRPDVPAAELESLGRSYAADWCVDGCFTQSELESTVRLFYDRSASSSGAAPPLAAWTDRSILSKALDLVRREEARSSR